MNSVFPRRMLCALMALVLLPVLPVGAVPGHADPAWLAALISQKEGQADGTPQPGQNPYTDVPADHPAYAAIACVSGRGLLPGTGETTFSPDAPITRGQLLTMIWLFEDFPCVNLIMPFSDVPDEKPYTEAVRWGAAVKLVEGYEDGTFRPEESVGREEAASILYRWVKAKGQGFSGMWMFPLRYADAAQVSAWAYEPICWLTMKGIYPTRADGSLAPADAATRAEAAQMFCALLSLITGV